MASTVASGKSSEGEEGLQRKLYWSQTRHAITIRLELVDDSIKGKNINVDVQGILPFNERTMAVGTNKPKLLVTAATTTITATNKRNTKNKIIIIITIIKRHQNH